MLLSYWLLVTGCYFLILCLILKNLNHHKKSAFLLFRLEVYLSYQLSTVICHLSTVNCHLSSIFVVRGPSSVVLTPVICQLSSLFLVRGPSSVVLTPITDYY